MTSTLVPVPSPDPREIQRFERSEATRCVVSGDRLVVSGDIDRATVGIVRQGLVLALHDAGVRVIDLTGVTFFGSDGVGLLEEFALHHRYQVIGNARIRRVLDIVRRSDLVDSVSGAR